jgi:hypothetical protein
VVYDQPLTAPDIAQGKALAAKGLTPAPPASGLSDASLGQIALTRQGFQPKELLFPGFGLNVSPTGGVIPYDNRGGPQGGMEIAYWPGTAPQGIFGVAAIHKSGLPVNYTINAFYNGSPLPITYSNSTASSNIPILSTNELKGTATGGINDLFESGVVLFPYNSYLESQVPQGNGETLGYVASPTTPSASHAVKPVKHNNTAKPAPASAAPASAAPRAAPVRTR